MKDDARNHEREDTDAVCVAIASALCLKKKIGDKEQIRPLDQGMVQAKTTINTQKSYDRLKAA
jgi:anthranilate phosphoribosyltransferase